MPLRANATLLAGSGAGVRGLVVQDGRCGPRGKTAPLGYQEAVSGDGERGVVVKAAPAAAFKVAQAEFLFQFLIVAFDDPALFGQRGQIAQLAVFPPDWTSSI